MIFLFQAEDGIRDLVRSRGLGDVYKRQVQRAANQPRQVAAARAEVLPLARGRLRRHHRHHICLLYTSDAADERSSVDLGGRRIIKKKNTLTTTHHLSHILTYHEHTTAPIRIQET